MNTIASSLGLCPINFKLFERINNKLNNLEASLLFSKLKFHQTNSKLKKSGRTCIARSRSQIAAWFGFSTKKVDKILNHLTTSGLLQKEVGLWYGKKRLFLSTTADINAVPINLKRLHILAEVCQSLQGSLIFSKIAFSYANTKITHENKKWCCLKKASLATWSGLSIRTLDTIEEGLIRKGLILKKKFSWDGKLQTHYHIPDSVITSLLERINPPDTINQPVIFDTEATCSQDINTQNCRSEPAKKGSSIKIRSNSKKTNNNTQPHHTQTRTQRQEPTGSDIIFDQINETLSNRQEKYLKAAFRRTIKRGNLNISTPAELWEQLKFSVTNPQQHPNISSFKHIVSRCMKILFDGNWKTPIGFHNHSASGQKLKHYAKKRDQKWQKCKQQETIRSFCIEPSHIPDHAEELTHQAIRVAKKIIESTEKEGEDTVLLDYLTNELHHLISRGANSSLVVAYLQQYSS